MLFNFQKLNDRASIRPLILSLIIIWLLIIKNYLLTYPAKNNSLPIQKHHQTQQILNLLNSLRRLKHKNCLIKKIQIEQHEVLIFGSSVEEEAFSLLEKNMNEFIWVKHMEVKQWDFIKPGKWRFVLGVVY